MSSKASAPEAAESQNTAPQNTDEALKEFQKKFKAEMEEFLAKYDENEKPRILIAGSAGSGKSTVCNLVFNREIAARGSGEPATPGVKKFSVPDIPAIICESEGYETGARFFDLGNSAEDDGQKYCDIIMNAVKNEQIDLIWYCISAPGGHVTDADISVIKELRTFKKPAAVVLTQIDAATEEDCEELKKIIAQKADGPHPDPSRKIAIFESTADPEIKVPQGIPELHVWSINHLPASHQDAFVISCHRGFDEKNKLAQKWIKAAATAADRTSFSPQPFSDTMLITPVQITLYAKLLHLWNMTDYEKLLGIGIAETVMPALEKNMAGNLVNIIPGAGAVIGGIINTGMTSTRIYAVGMALNKSCRLLMEKLRLGSMTASAVQEVLSSEALTSAIQEYSRSYHRKKEDNATQETQDTKQGKSQMDNYVTNILILGKTGAGKSTLVNYLYDKKIAVAKVGRPVTGKGLHRHDPFTYKNMNIVIWDSWGLEPDKARKWWENLKEELTRQSGQPNITDWIHTVIYCYDAKKSRLDDYESEHILKPLIDMGYRVIFALTKWGLCSDYEKEAARRVLAENYPGFSAIPVESISQKLRGGKTTSQKGREDLFREICLNLRRSLMYHLRIRTMNEMEEALNRAENAALAYYDENTGYIFTIYDEDLMNEIQNIARKSYENNIKEVYDRLRNNISLIDRMCVAVIRGYTGVDVSEKLKGLDVIMSSIKDTRITAWTGYGSEYVDSILASIFTAGLYIFIRKSSYREDLQKTLRKISGQLKKDLESFADTLDNEEIEVNEEIAAELTKQEPKSIATDPGEKKTEENKGSSSESDHNDTAVRIVMIKGVPTELRLISPAVRN